jgi:hypothetical protein
VIVKQVVIISFAKRSRRVGSKANPDRLVRLIFLIALAMTSAWLHGQRTKLQKQESYICRTQEKSRTSKRHSNFWIGLYGQNWIVAWNECQAWVEELVASIRNKQSFYLRGLRAMKLIQKALWLACRPLKS